MYSFDFNDNPVKLYGIWPMTPFPVEVSIYGVCSNRCFYCFANLNRAAAGRQPHEKNPIERVINGLERSMKDPTDPIGYFLREKYPVCFSNTTDPFMKEEKIYRCTEAFLKWAKARNIPLWIQTKGGVLLEEFDRYAPLIVPGKDAVYITLTTLDPDVSRKIEPGAPLPAARLELIRKLSDRGVPVVVACNPYLDEWAGDPQTYCETVKAAGARGIWFEELHFSTKQAEQIPETYHDYIRKANVFDRLHIGTLKTWYKIVEKLGLDFYPAFYFDNYFGHRAKFAECADPSWFGKESHLFTAGFDFLKHVQDRAYNGQKPYDDDLNVAKVDGKKKIIFSWPGVERYLQSVGLKNPMLRTDPFWVPFNATITADHRKFKATLGKEAPLYEILRYFYNNPEDNSNLIWYCSLAQLMTDYDAQSKDGEGVYPTNDNGDLICVYNPFNRDRGHYEQYHDIREYDKHQDEYIPLYKPD
jgi:DNA repair photolyase